MKRPELKGKLVCLSCGYCDLADRFFHDEDGESFCPHCRGNDIHAAETVDWCDLCASNPLRLGHTDSSCETCLTAEDEELAQQLEEREQWGDDYDEGDLPDYIPLFP